MRRSRRNVIESDPEDDEPMPVASPPPPPLPSLQYNMDTDISKLEAPTFTTLERGPSKTMLSLDWDHKLNLIGKKVANPMIHCCDRCLRPILIYGRVIPCKHVFCLQCAKTSYEQVAQCPRCGDKANRVEQAGLGSIFMCSHGGSRYGHNGCRRTYLSQRDLQAHIHHRHMKEVSGAAIPALATVLPELPSAAAIAEATAAIVNARKRTDGHHPSTASAGGGHRTFEGAAAHHRSGAKSAAVGGSHHTFQSPPPTHAGSAQSGRTHYAGASYGGGGGSHAQQPIAVISSSSTSGSSGNRQSNLITIPIQDSGLPPSTTPHGAKSSGSDGRTSEHYAGQAGAVFAGANTAYASQMAVDYGSTGTANVTPGSNGNSHFSQPPPNFYHAPPPQGGSNGAGAGYTGSSVGNHYPQPTTGGSGSGAWSNRSGAQSGGSGGSSYYRR